MGSRFPLGGAATFVRDVVKVAEQHGVDYTWTSERAEAVLRREWGAEFDVNSPRQLRW